MNGGKIGMGTARMLVIAAGLALTASGVGCSSSVTSESKVGQATSDRAVVESAAPSSVVQAERISEHVAERIEYIPWPTEDEIPTAHAATGQSPRLVITRERTDAPEGMETTPMEPITSWLVRRYRLGAGDNGTKSMVREARLVLTEGGSVALSQEKNLIEGVVVDFEPPLWVLPAMLPSGGEACVFESVKMTVHPSDALDKVKASGKVQHTVCYEADETLNTPAGRFRTHRLVSRFEADLGTSRVENITTQWFAPDLGIIAERRHEQTFALGVRIRDNQESWIASKVEGGGEKPAE